MRTHRLVTLALTLAGALRAQAADPAATATEVEALKARVEELERKQAEAARPGMTTEQQQDFNRIAVKAEALEDARDNAGLKGFKVAGALDLVYAYNHNLQRAQFVFLTPGADVGYGYDNGYFGTVTLDVQKETGRRQQVPAHADAGPLLRRHRGGDGQHRPRGLVLHPARESPRPASSAARSPTGPATSTSPPPRTSSSPTTCSSTSPCRPSTPAWGWSWSAASGR